MSESSGCLDLSDATSKYSLSRTHFNMNKFGKPTEEDFEIVSDVLKNISMSSHGLMMARSQRNFISLPLDRITQVDWVTDDDKHISRICNVPVVSNFASQSALMQFYLDPTEARNIREKPPQLTKNTLRDYSVQTGRAIGNLVEGREQLADQVSQRRTTCSEDDSEMVLSKQFTLPGTSETITQRISYSSTVNGNGRSSEGSVVPFQLQIHTHKSASWLWYLGFLGSFVRRKGRGVDIFSASIRYHPPGAWTRRRYLIMADFAYLHMSNPWKMKMTFNLMPLSVVPENAEIIQACKHGYLSLARKLFRTKEASIYDITSDNNSLLYVSDTNIFFIAAVADPCLEFAIEGGHIELIRLLLDEGADVNQTFGKNQT